MARDHLRGECGLNSFMQLATLQQCGVGRRVQPKLVLHHGEEPGLVYPGREQGIKVCRDRASTGLAPRERRVPCDNDSAGLLNRNARVQVLEKCVGVLMAGAGRA